MSAPKNVASLVWITPHAEDSIVFTARVSNPEGQDSGANQAKLIKYLADHGHWSPFEMANLCLEINTTRDIARQILRHRSFTFQEFSQRYQVVNKLGMEPQIPKARRQDLKNRQNSIDDMSEVDQSWWNWQCENMWEHALKTYHAALAAGVAKEVARAVLPEGLAPSRLYVNGTIRSWIHYLQVRLDPSTQLEHRNVAKACLVIFKQHLPVITEALTLDAEFTKED